MLRAVLYSSIFFLSFIITSPYFIDEVNYYEYFLNKAYNESLKYRLKTSSTNYKALETGPPKDIGVYDFIIVGAGSTGSVIARRLSEVFYWKILVIEAGEWGNDLTSVPATSYKITLMSDFNWGYYSVPQTNFCLGFQENRCPHPRGKGVGGSSLLNALIYIRGNKKDYDIWCGMGNQGWCYEDVLPFFLKSESYYHTDADAPYEPSLHNYFGPLRVEQPMPRHAHSKIFLKASEEMGYQIRDVNGKEQIGVMPFVINSKKGRRQDGGTAFLKPVLHRKNLKVLTGSLVTKILIKDKVAKGILFLKNGILYKAKSKKEVIVCGGTINSPQLLMLSGIGPKEHLKEHKIELIEDLPVGASFSDHLQVSGLVFSSNLTEPMKTLRSSIKEFLEYGIGQLAEAVPSQAVGYFRTKLEKDANYPDLELSIQDTNYTLDALNNYFKWRSDIVEYIGGVKKATSFQIFVAPIHTKSLGWVKLRSSNPLDYPEINPNILSDPDEHDLDLVYEGVQFVLNLTKQEAFRKINTKFEQKPLPQCRDFQFMTKEYWRCASKFLVNHNNHPVGTCKMGPDPKTHVVDDNVRVHGIRNLRVADASVIPLSMSAHINAICYMIGEKVADLIKATWQVSWIDKFTRIVFHLLSIFIPH